MSSVVVGPTVGGTSPAGRRWPTGRRMSVPVTTTVPARPWYPIGIQRQFGRRGGSSGTEHAADGGRVLQRAVEVDIVAGRERQMQRRVGTAREVRPQRPLVGVVPQQLADAGTETPPGRPILGEQRVEVLRFHRAQRVVDGAVEVTGGGGGAQVEDHRPDPDPDPGRIGPEREGAVGQ